MLSLSRIRERLFDRFRVAKSQRPPRPRRPRLTRLAKILGDSQSYLFSVDPLRGKSGITPRDIGLNRPILSPLEDAEHQLFNDYQIDQLRFTTQQLFDLRVLSNTQHLKNNLQNEIFQGFSRDKWKTVGTMSMYDGTARYWTMHHEDVYEACLPSLRLASRMMTHAQNNDWWDALISGPRRPIPTHRLPPTINRPNFLTGLPQTITDLRLQTFHRRTPEARATHPVDWTTTVPYIKLEIQGDDDNQPTGDFVGLTVSDFPAAEFQTGKVVRGNITLRLNPRILFPLLRLPLAENERLAHQFYVACTLVHEYAHAVSYSIDRPFYSLANNIPQTQEEPYYEDEIVSELGYSAENALFGGSVPEFPLTDPREYPPHPDPLFSRGHPYIFSGIKTYPHWRDIRKNHTRFAGVPFLIPTPPPSPILTATTHPFPLRFIQDVQQEDFWEVKVNQLGGQALRLWPKLLGYYDCGRVDDEEYEEKRFGVMKWPVYDTWVSLNRPDPNQFALSQGFTHYDIVRVTEALRIRDHLTARMKENMRRAKQLEAMMTPKVEEEVKRYMEEFVRAETEWDDERVRVYLEELDREKKSSKKRKRGWVKIFGGRARRGVGVENEGDGQGGGDEGDDEGEYYRLYDVLQDVCRKRLDKRGAEPLENMGI